MQAVDACEKKVIRDGLFFVDLFNGVLIILFIKAFFQSGNLNPEVAVKGKYPPCLYEARPWHGMTKNMMRAISWMKRVT